MSGVANRSLSRRRRFGFLAAATLLGLGAVELAARLALAFWPAPPAELRVVGRELDTSWLEVLAADLDAPENAAQLYATDPELFWRLRPGAELAPVNVVYETRDEPVRWRVTVDRRGRRGPAAEPGGAPRVVALGDSCTFGYRVDDDDTYPAQLRTILRERGQPRAEVVNYGVPGYSSYQGRRLLDRVLAGDRPDVVVLGFGANDRETDRWSDAEKAGRLTALRVRTAQLLDRAAIARLLRRALDDGEGEPSDPGVGAAGAAKPRVSLTEYEANLRAMVGAARAAGARVILLDLVFVEPLFRDCIARVAADEGVAWLDGRELLRAGLRELEPGGRLVAARYRMDQFWRRVERYRLVYYDQEFYDRLYQDPEWKQLLRYFMVEPVHANALGNRLIAERLAELIAEPATE